MGYSRREFLAAAGIAAAACALPTLCGAAEGTPSKKRYIVTLSFDDGFRKSFVRTTEIYEKHKLSACLNVVAAGLPEDCLHRETPPLATSDSGTS